MTRFATKTSLLLGVAVLALTACGNSKGPGALGTTNDIVVRNNGLPGAVAPVPPSAQGEISSTVEQGEAVPAPDVAQAPLEIPAEAKAPVASAVTAPMNDATAPASEPTQADVIPAEPVTPTAEAPVEELLSAVPTQVAAPVETPAAAPVETPAVAPTPTQQRVQTISAPQGTPIEASDNTFVPDDAPAAAVAALNATRLHDAKAPEAAAPVATPAVSAPAPATASTSAYTPEAYAAPAPVAQEAETSSVTVYETAPAPVAQTAPVSPSSVYPIEDYAPEALAQAQVQSAPSSSAIAPPQGTEIIPPAAPAPAINFQEPAIIKLAQDALKRKGAYVGKEDGIPNTQYLNALSKYQADNKLPQGGLNIETLRHMGVLQ